MLSEKPLPRAGSVGCELARSAVRAKRHELAHPVAPVAPPLGDSSLFVADVAARSRGEERRSFNGNDWRSRTLFGGVTWFRKPGFKLVPVKDVRRLTGLELSELLSRQNIQRLTRIDESGAREEFVRVPVELLIEEPAD
jgi:hypothetical protein